MMGEFVSFCPHPIAHSLSLSGFCQYRASLCILDRCFTYIEERHGCFSFFCSTTIDCCYRLHHCHYLDLFSLLFFFVNSFFGEKYKNKNAETQKKKMIPQSNVNSNYLVVGLINEIPASFSRSLLKR
jgi:hypothetical protein